MDAKSTRSFVGRFAVVVALALVMLSMLSGSASAENASTKVIGHTLVVHANGALTLGEVSAFTIDSATSRTIDETSRTVRDTGMIVDFPQSGLAASGCQTLSSVGSVPGGENSGMKVIGHTLVEHSNGVYTLAAVQAFTIDTALQRTVDESTRTVCDTGMLVDLPNGLVD